MSRGEMRMHAVGETMDGSDYTNMHRAFLQAFLARSVMSFDEIKPVLAAVMNAGDPDRPTLEGDITAPIITSAIQTINARLAPLDYEIRSTRDQVSKSHIYALVNTTSDALTQLATTFSPDEIAYIKRLLDCMFETNNTRQREIMAVSYRDAGRLAKAPRGAARQSQINNNADHPDQSTSQVEAAPVKGIDMNQSDNVLQQLVDQGFFRKSRVAQADYFSLAPRGLMELRAYLKETYNEPADPDDPDDEGIIRIRDCEGCREIVTVGVRCDDRNCGVRFHDACAAQYFRNLRGGRECPGCRTSWSGQLCVGPRAADVGGRPSAVGHSRMSGASERGYQDGEDEEEEDE